MNFNRKRRRPLSKQRYPPLKKWKVTCCKSGNKKYVLYNYVDLEILFLARCDKEDERDIIWRLNERTTHVVEHIFSFLDYESIANAEKVSSQWQEILKNERIWKALIERNAAADPVWRSIFTEMKQMIHSSFDTVQASRRICRQVAELRTQYSILMSSSVKWLSSTLSLMSTVFEILKHVGCVEHSLDINLD